MKYLRYEWEGAEFVKKAVLTTLLLWTEWGLHWTTDPMSCVLVGDFAELTLSFAFSHLEVKV